MVQEGPLPTDPRTPAALPLSPWEASRGTGLPGAHVLGVGLSPLQPSRALQQPAQS